MAWGQAMLTNAGKQLHAAVMANKLKLKIEEVWLGDGNVTDVNTANELGNKRLKLDLISITQQDVDCLIRFKISNKTVNTSIMMKEIGFYARNEQNRLILYSVMKDDTPYTLPASSSQTGIYEENMNVAFGYSNAAQVVMTPTIQEGTTVDQVMSMLQLHDQSNSSHLGIVNMIKNISLEQLAKATGVKYDFSNENAWYICLGKAFGGLIIQGGETNLLNKSKPWNISFPITFTSKVIFIATTRLSGGYSFSHIITNTDLSSFSFIDADYRGNSGNGDRVKFTALGY